MNIQSRFYMRVAILAIAAVAVVFLFAGNFSRSQAAPQSANGKVMHTDDYQRSARLDTYRVIADSGDGRGENIYFYKCWMCHNQYAKTGPYLRELFKRESLMSGDPMTVENVVKKIREGGPGMPAFGTTIKDSDIADVVTYIKDGKCCVEGENPGPNPWYRAETNKWSVQSGLNGGATGSVKIPSGDSPEGIGVQLIAPNGVRTTVYTNAQGHFEFPRCKPATTSCASRLRCCSSPM
jgi:mono/diheme cytochrome c family protein